MFNFILRPLYSQKETRRPFNRRLGGLHSLSERFEVEKNFYAWIQTPNRVHSVVTLPSATAKFMRTVLRGSDTFYVQGIQNCPLTTL